MQAINNYVESLFTVNDPNLQAILNSIEENGIRNISVSPATGQCLTTLVKIKRPKHILEIGALGGYSGLCMLKGMADEGTLTSLELQEGYARLAAQNLTNAGYGERVSYRVGDANASLQQLIDEAAQFDFFFIDANKDSYMDYLNKCLQLATEQAVVIIDNVLVDGKVADQDQQDEWSDKYKKRVQIAHEFNEYVSKHPQLFSTLLPIGDGLLCAVVQK